MAKAVKMSDIAQKLKVSTVTVSKALGDQKGVSKELREKIKNLAEEMGYQKPEAKPMNRDGGFSIGVLVAEENVEKYKSFYWELYQEISRSAARHNCFVMLEIISKGERESSIPNVVKENKVDGVFVLGEVESSCLDAWKAQVLVPVVYLDFYDADLLEDAVVPNSYYGMYRLTNYLFEMGHEDIGFIGAMQTTRGNADCYFGYMKSLLEHGKKIREEWMFEECDGGKTMLEEPVFHKEMPTAFVCQCDITAGWFIRALQKAGYRVPEDVSVVGFHDFIYPGLCDVALTTYKVDLQEMAECGLQLMIKKMNGEATTGGIHLIGGSLLERDSVKRI